MALQGVDQPMDWRAKQSLGKCQQFLRQHVLWSIDYINRDCNRCACNVSRWARNCNASGSLDVTMLPPEALCDRDGTDILEEAVEIYIVNHSPTKNIYIYKQNILQMVCA